MRRWLDGVDEATGTYPTFRRPTRVERFISDYFEHWLEDAKHDQEQQRKSSREVSLDEETRGIRGFGMANDEAIEQWLSFAKQHNDSDDPKPDEVEVE